MKVALYLLMAIILSELAVAQQDGVILIHLKREEGMVDAELIVEDVLGRKTGYDPISKTYYKGIPNASYGDEGIGSEDPNEPIIITNVFNMDPATSGIYSIKVIGGGIDSFKLLISTAGGNGKGQSFHYKGIVGRGSISNYQLNYYTNPDREIVAEKVVNSCSDIRQDLDLCYKISWITNKDIYNGLSKKIDNAEKQADKGKYKTAINNLNAFINHLNAQRGKHLTEDCADILIEDAEALIRNW